MSYIIDNILNHKIIGFEIYKKDENIINNIEDEHIEDRNIKKIYTITETPVIEKVITETEYIDHNFGEVEHINLAEVGIIPNNLSDLLILFPDYMRNYGKSLLKRYAMMDMKFVLAVLIILNILILLSLSSGINSDWYQNQKDEPITNMFGVAIFWMLVIGMSYLSLLFLWKDVSIETIRDDFVISNYFIIGSFLTLLWVTSYFQANNISMAYWMSLLLLMYQFWLLIVVWHINRKSAIFLVPSFILYAYIFYNMVRIVRDDNINI